MIFKTDLANPATNAIIPDKIYWFAWSHANVDKKCFDALQTEDNPISNEDMRTYFFHLRGLILAPPHRKKLLCPSVLKYEAILQLEADLVCVCVKVLFTATDCSVCDWG
jgi:hypothetical protein